MDESKCTTCHECARDGTFHNLALARIFVMGVISALLVLLGGCLIQHEWTLREVKVIGGQIKENFNGFRPGDVYVEPAVPKKEGGK